MATAAQAAKHICLGVARFRDLVAMGVIPHAPSGKYDLDVTREAYISSLQRKASGREEEGGGSLSAQRTRLASAQADRAVLRNQRDAGEYVPLAIFAKVFTRDLMAIREHLLGIPGQCADSISAHSPTDRGVIFEIIRDKVHEALDHVADGDFIKEVRREAGRKASYHVTDATEAAE